MRRRTSTMPRLGARDAHAVAQSEGGVLVDRGPEHDGIFAGMCVEVAAQVVERFEHGDTRAEADRNVSARVGSASTMTLISGLLTSSGRSPRSSAARSEYWSRA